MEVIKSSSIEEAVRHVVQMNIEAEVAKIVGEYKEKAIGDLEKAIRKAVVDTAVYFSKIINVKDCGESITITIIDKRNQSVT